MTEIKSIKRILEQIKAAKEEDAHVLCFVDEVLRGTNTVERIAASTQILKMFAEEHVICFAATHDVELTVLLAGQYHNYHFEEKIEGEDIRFPYRLLEGPAASRNAIALLKALGYDEKMVAEAEKMAEHFLQTGTWS
jgi:DNA mismatch repair ATPase MutS